MPMVSFIPTSPEQMAVRPASGVRVFGPKLERVPRPLIKQLSTEEPHRSQLGGRTILFSTEPIVVVSQEKIRLYVEDERQSATVANAVISRVACEPVWADALVEDILQNTRARGKSCQ